MVDYLGENDYKTHFFLVFFNNIVSNTNRALLNIYIQNTQERFSLTFLKFWIFFLQYLFTFYGEHMPAVSIVGYYIIRTCFKVHVHNQYLQATIFIKLFKGRFYGQYYMFKYFLKMFNGICRLPLIASYTLGHIFG